MELSIKNLVKLAVSIFLIAFALLNAGCKKSSARKEVQFARNDVQLAGRGFNSKAMADTAYYDSVEYEMAEESAPEAYVEEYERKLIRTGNVSLEVQTISDAEDKIAAWAKSLGGYVTNANTWQYGAGFTVRIPAERFDEAMSQVGDFGRVTNRSVNSQDVSDNYYDMQSRLETKYILRDKLQSYLNQAKDIKDLLEIERQLIKRFHKLFKSTKC